MHLRNYVRFSYHPKGMVKSRETDPWQRRYLDSRMAGQSWPVPCLPCLALPCLLHGRICLGVRGRDGEILHLYHTQPGYSFVCLLLKVPSILVLLRTLQPFAHRIYFS